MSSLAEGSSSCNEASAVQSNPDDQTRSSSNLLRVTILGDEWGSSKGGLSTINKELAIQLAKHPNLDISVYLPQCNAKDKSDASVHNVQLMEAEELPGYDPIDWLTVVPENHAIDIIIGHGVRLGRQIPIIKKHCGCGWIQTVHTAPEELGKYKTYADAISKGEKKHQVEVKLCERADQVLAVGPKLAEAYRRYLRSSQKDQAVLDLTPGIFSQFSQVKQVSKDGKTFGVLVFGRGDSEDFCLKGYDIAVKAVARLEKSSYHLTFVGAPAGKEDEVTEQLERWGIFRRQLTVRCFDESRESLAKLFCEMDLVLMPSRTEGFGLTALEAMSGGLPILVSSNSGFGEALKQVPFGNQFVVDSEDPEKWAEAIRAVRKKDRNLRLEEAKHLQKMYASKFSWKEQCDSLYEAMCSIMSRSTNDLNSTTIPGSQFTLVNPNQADQGAGHLASNPEGSIADLDLTTIPRSQSTLVNPNQADQGAGHLASNPEDPSAKQPSRKRKQSISPGVQAPKQCRLVLDDKEDHFTLVVKRLQAEYKRRSLVKPLPWNNTLQLQLDDTYTRLKFLSRRKRDFMLENLAIDINDMFVFHKGEDSMVLIEGSPGIGKTTFCLNVANKWARERSAENSQLSINFELVLLLKCRDFEGDVMEAICNQLLPEDCDEEIRSNLMDFLKDFHNQEKVLLILDGLDELPTRSKCHVDKLLNRQILPFCFVLVTCRQERGISARKEFQFEIHFQIEGFTNKAASDFVMRYFENISPTNGQKLMAEIKENTLLQALLNNPLNLLLLCVVFEDSQGKLPSSRTNLYQIIVCCLLRRFCVKHKLKSHPDNKILQKQFEESVLALGELAWNCLLQDRHSFLEEELASLERRTDGLVARYIGLVFKEASVKKLNPSDEYHFLHKTFQEFLAASYLAHSLRKDDINIFRDFVLEFHDVVTKYQQVFLFAVGILEQNDVLFRQVGEELLEDNGEWNWLQCSEEEATFFTECLKESGNSEDMAYTLFSLIPLPQDIEIIHDVHHYSENFVPILKVCQAFPRLKQPVNLFIPDGNFLEDCEVKTITDVLESSCHLENLDFSASEMTKALADALFEGLSSNLSLTHLSINVSHSMASDQAYIIGKALAASKNLRTVAMVIGNDWDETWASALEQGLTAETQLRGVILTICGTMSQTTLQALIHLFKNKSLVSLSIFLAGDMHDSVASAINEGLTTADYLESFQLVIFGNLSYSGAISLEKACFQNQSLKTLQVIVRGEVPENWSTTVLRLMPSKTASLSCDFQPSICHKVTETQIYHLISHIFPSGRFLSGQSLTLTLWGGLTCSGAKALHKVIRSSGISSLTLNVHGKLDKEVVHCLAEYKKHTKTLSSLKVNFCCYLSEEEKSVFHDLPSNGQEFEISNDLNFLQEESSSCISESSDSYHLKSRSETCEVNLTSSSTSEDSALLERLHDGLQNTVPLTTLSISINFDASLSGNWSSGLATALAENTSVTTFSLTINNYDDMSGAWGCCLGEAMERNTSVTTLKLTFNNYANMSGDWAQGLADGLARNTSVTTHYLAINDFGDTSGDWAYTLGDAYTKNTNLTSLYLKINNHSTLSDDWLEGLCNSLSRSNSISKLHFYLNGQDVFLVNGSLRKKS